ncbi:MAG: hypothetical protein WC455_16810 [Dehalococcoidia bacterium]|jgi:hypothetical protein
MSEFKVGDRVLFRDTVSGGEHIIIEISGGNARLDEPGGYWYPIRFMDKIDDAPEVEDDGGPAFPIGSGDMRDPHGMSLRDYFIAHAPAEPQEWFTPRDRDGDASCAIFVGDEDYVKQRFIQWPAAWADEQIKARK